MSDGEDSDAGYNSSSSESSEEDEIDIHLLVRSGSLEEIDWALQKDRFRLLNLKEVGSEMSALHCACAEGRIPAASLLLKRGAIVDVRDGFARTALMVACNNGHTECGRFLLERGADIRLRDKLCQTALHHAVEHGHVETCTMLIKRGVDLSAEEAKYGKTALHFAAEQGLSELTDVLIVRGSDMYASGDSIYSRTPLHLACLNGHANTADVLVKRGADLEAMSGFLDKTPLHLACDNGHLDCVKVLVAAGADMGAMGFNINGASPLHLAAQNGHHEIVRYLVTKGASMTLQGKWTCEGTALHIAAQYGNEAVVNVLIESGADIEQKDLNGNTSMHTACKASAFNICRNLIWAGADLTIMANNGRFPLEMIPNQESHMREELRLLGIDYENEMQRRAEEAARKKAEEEAEANRKFAEETERQRLAELARLDRERRSARMCALLLACCEVSGELSALTDITIEFPDLDINTTLESVRGSYALTRAACNGYNVIVEALLRWPGIDVDIQEKDGNTALHLAASRGKVQHRIIVEMLLRAGARTGIANNLGKTAATVATTTYIAEIIRSPYLMTSSADIQWDAPVGFQGPPVNVSRTVDTYNDHVYDPRSMHNSIAFGTGNSVTDDHSLGSFQTMQVPQLGGKGAYTPVSAIPQIRPDRNAHQGLLGTGGNRASEFENTRAFLPQASRNDSKNRSRAGPIEEQKFDSESFGRLKFGAAPAHYQGCKGDLFFLVYNDRVPVSFQYLLASEKTLREKFGGTGAIRNVSDITNCSVGVSDYPIQASYTPTIFDTTDEWNAVKDFLWMLGYPYYKHTKKTEDAVLGDPRAKLHEIGKILDEVQRVFTDPATAGYFVDFEHDKLTRKGKQGSGDVQLKALCLNFVKLSVQLYVPSAMAKSYSRSKLVEALQSMVASLFNDGLIPEELKELLLAVIEYGTRTGPAKLKIRKDERVNKEREEMAAEDNSGNNRISFHTESIEEHDEENAKDASQNSVEYSPRERRHIVDIMYEICFVFKERAEQDFPTDNVRIRYWAHGNASKKNLFSDKLIYNMSLEVMLWLQDIHLEEYVMDFEENGFKLLSDFLELNLADCREYFPFLKIGDAIRLANNIQLLQPEIIGGYRLRAEKREVTVTLPPIPGATL